MHSSVDRAQKMLQTSPFRSHADSAPHDVASFGAARHLELPVVKWSAGTIGPTPLMSLPVPHLWPIEVKQIPGAGRGLLLLKDVAAGETIFHEEPFLRLTVGATPINPKPKWLTYDASRSPLNWELDNRLASWHGKPACFESSMLAALDSGFHGYDARNLTPPNYLRSEPLVGDLRLDLAMRKVWSNTIEVNHKFCLYSWITMMNHCCTPNVALARRPPGRTASLPFEGQAVLALHNLRRGDELVWNYTGIDAYKPWADRDGYFKTHGYEHCPCRACKSGPSSASIEQFKQTELHRAAVLAVYHDNQKVLTKADVPTLSFLPDVGLFGDSGELSGHWLFVRARKALESGNRTRAKKLALEAIEMERWRNHSDSLDLMIRWTNACFAPVKDGF